MNHNFLFNDFSFMEDDHEKRMIQDALNATLQVPGGLEEMSKDPGNHGFMFSKPSEIRKLIDNALSETPTGGLHSGSSYGWTMRNVQAIARLGWNVYVSQYLSQINLPKINNNNIPYISDIKKSILEKENINVCAICLCNNNDDCHIVNSLPLENIDTTSLIKCGHVFHKKCLNGWITNHNTCPLCREQIISLYDIDFELS
jgi:hypothetical protein